MDKQHYLESSLSILVFKLKADKNTICDIYVFLRRFYVKTCYCWILYYTHWKIRFLSQYHIAVAYLVAMEIIPLYQKLRFLIFRKNLN